MLTDLEGNTWLRVGQWLPFLIWEPGRLHWLGGSHRFYLPWIIGTHLKRVSIFHDQTIVWQIHWVSGFKSPCHCWPMKYESGLSMWIPNTFSKKSSGKLLDQLILLYLSSNWGQVPRDPAPDYHPSTGWWRLAFPSHLEPNGHLFQGTGKGYWYLKDPRYIPERLFPKPVS